MGTAKAGTFSLPIVHIYLPGDSEDINSLSCILFAYSIMNHIIYIYIYIFHLV